MLEQFLGFGVLFALVVGGYKFTYDRTKKMADKEDVAKLEVRIDKIYELLLEIRKNGIHRNSN